MLDTPTGGFDWSNGTGLTLVATTGTPTAYFTWELVTPPGTDLIDLSAWSTSVLGQAVVVPGRQWAAT